MIFEIIKCIRVQPIKYSYHVLNAAPIISEIYKVYERYQYGQQAYKECIFYVKRCCIVVKAFLVCAKLCKDS